EPGDPTGRPKFLGAEERDKNFQQQSQHLIYTFDALSDPLPGLRRLRFGVNHGTNHLKLVDRRDGKELLSEPIKEQFSQFMNPQLAMPNPNFMPANPNQQIPTNRFGYRSVGHLMVANLGQYLVAVDAIKHTLLWEKNLFGSYGPGSTSPVYNAAEETLELFFQDNM